MTNYLILASKQQYRLTEQGGLVTNSTFEFFDGLPWNTVRALLEGKGWTIIPELEPLNVFEFRGHEYTIQWHGERISSVTKDGQEIKYQELPEQLKNLL
jgi:hypothetical protein